MSDPYTLGAGLLTSYFGARSARKAARETADAMRYAADTEAKTIRTLTEPYLEQSRWALPQIRNTIQTQLAPQVGRESSALKGAHDLSLSSINRDRNKARASSFQF